MKVYHFIICVCVVELVPDNLKDIQDLVWDARTKWSNLGLELGIKIGDLEVIEQNCKSDIETCFKNMLLMWLRMVDPLPTWDSLVSALGKSSVGRKDLAENIRKKYIVSSDSSSSASSVSNTAGQYIIHIINFMLGSGGAIESVHLV